MAPLVTAPKGTPSLRNAPVRLSPPSRSARYAACDTMPGDHTTSGNATPAANANAKRVSSLAKKTRVSS